MRKPEYLRIKNELPELLEAVCRHADCEEWLRLLIWEGFAERSRTMIYSANWWRSEIEAQEPGQDDDSNATPTSETKGKGNILNFNATVG